MTFLRNTPVGALILSVSAGEWTNRGKEIMKDQCMIKNKLWEIHAGLLRFSP